jgi:hypothetical protein
MGVPLLWYTDVALALRWQDDRESQLRVEPATHDPDAFRQSHLAVAWARRQAVVVLSPRQELGRGAIRVLAMHGYREEERLGRARARIERGEVPEFVHVAGNERLGWADGVVALSQILELPRSLFEGGYVPGVEQAASLSDGTLALVLARLRAYLALVDRGRPRR